MHLPVCALIILFLQGLVAYEDFKRVFHGAEDDLESHGDATFEAIAPKNMPELVDLQKVLDCDCGR